MNFRSSCSGDDGDNRVGGGGGDGGGNIGGGGDNGVGGGGDDGGSCSGGDGHCKEVQFAFYIGDRNYIIHLKFAAK